MHRKTLAVLALLGGMGAAHADAPMATEHAEPLAPGECEWEASLERVRGGGVTARGGTTNVGCAVNERFDLGLAYARMKEGTLSARLLELYGRATLFKGKEDGPNLGLVYGLGMRQQPEGRFRHDSTSLLLALTQPLGAWRLHLNLGAVQDRLDDETLRVWALGAEWTVHEDADLVAETYGEQHGKPAFGVGLRWRPAANWALGLMHAQQRGTPRLKGLNLTVQLVF
jgi:hypothetical protein